MLIYTTEKPCPQPMIIPEGIVTADEAAEASGYTPSYVRRLARWGRIRGKQAGNQWLIDLQSLLEYKRRIEAEGPSKFGRRYDDAAE